MSLRRSSEGLLLLTVSLGGVLAPLNSTMLAVALPEIRRDFGIGHAEIAWLVSAYLIAMAVAQPLGGRLGDQLGRAPVFRAGLILFLALSLAAGVAPTFPLLIVLRTGQALVGAAVIPNGMAMLRETVPPQRLGRAGGIIGSAISISAAVGPLLGAGLLALGSWRFLFLMNLPLVAAALVSVLALQYREVRPRSGRVSLDWLGALVFAGVLGIVTVLLNALRGSEAQAVVFAAVIALPVLLVLFVYQQFAAPQPVAEWRLFRIRSYAAATVSILLGNLVMYTALLSIPFFVEEVQGGSHGRSGELLTAISLPMVVISPVAGRISDAVGRRPLVTAGSFLLVVSTIVLTLGLEKGSSPGFLAPALGLLGLGMALSTGSASAAAIECAPRELAGAAAGTNSMMRYVGSIIGAGILGSVLNSDAAAPGIGLFRLIFAVLVVMSLLSAVAANFIHRFPGAEPTELPAADPGRLGAGRVRAR